MRFRRGARLGAALTAVAAGAVAATMFAAPAWAHVEVSADNAQAGARNVTVTFVGEAESNTAGIASEQVVLPAGISPQSVTLAKAPDGWTFTATADGFTVAGKALPTGEDATFSVTIAQLPSDATELVFKTVESYGDGKVSRWIEIPEAGKAEPDNPAPVLKLKPAAAVPTTAASTTPPASSAAQPTSPPAAAVASSGSSTGWWIAAAIVVLALIAGGILLARRRSKTPPTTP